MEQATEIYLEHYEQINKFNHKIHQIDICEDTFQYYLRCEKIHPRYDSWYFFKPLASIFPTLNEQQQHIMAAYASSKLVYPSLAYEDGTLLTKSQILDFFEHVPVNLIEKYVKNIKVHKDVQSDLDKLILYKSLHENLPTSAKSSYKTKI